MRRLGIEALVPYVLVKIEGEAEQLASKRGGGPGIRDTIPHGHRTTIIYPRSAQEVYARYNDIGSFEYLNGWGDGNKIGYFHTPSSVH